MISIGRQFFFMWLGRHVFYGGLLHL